MGPESRVTRKAARHESRNEPDYYPPAQRTRRQLEQDLVMETEAALARQAHLDRPEASMLGVLLLGCPGVDMITLD